MALTAAERQRRYRARHPDRVNEAKRRRARTEAAGAARRRKRRQDPRYDARAAAWRALRPGYAAAVAKRWREQHPERVAELERAKRIRRTAGVLPDDEDYGRVLLGDPCSYCGTTAEHIDHIIASSRGGINSWTNLTAACASCNTSKGFKPLLLFMLRVVSTYEQE